MSKALDPLFFLGRPFSPIYSSLMKLREYLYLTGVFRQQSVDVPVISIGNLVLGGTGKTPTVQHLAKLLVEHGYQPAIVCRGYGGKAKEAVNIVSDGKNVFLTAVLSGDEPNLHAHSVPGVPVLTGKRRIFPSRYATQQFNCDVIILDDGFQHLSVKRDLDVILFDSTALAGNSRVFPGGPLREPISALNRCHAFLLTGQNLSKQARTRQFANLLKQKFPERPVFLSSVNTARLLEQNGKVSHNGGTKKLFGFCGIANPLRFERSLLNLGVQLVGFQTLKDHSAYSQPLVAHLCDRAAERGAQALVTTEKDFIKLRDLKLSLPLYVLKVQQSIDQDFDHFVLEMLEKMKK